MKLPKDLIQDRQYSKKYVGQGKQVFEVGMVFNQTTRNLVQIGWEHFDGKIITQLW